MRFYFLGKNLLHNEDGFQILDNQKFDDHKIFKSDEKVIKKFFLPLT